MQGVVHALGAVAGRDGIAHRRHRRRRNRRRARCQVRHQRRCADPRCRHRRPARRRSTPAKISPRNLPLAYNNRGIAYADKRRVSTMRSRTTARRSGSIPASPSPTTIAALSMLDRGDPSLIAPSRTYGEAIRLDPKFALAHDGARQRLLRPQATISTARIADYSDAIRLDPKLAIAVHNRGLVYREQGRRSTEPSRDYTEAIRLDPISPRCLSTIAALPTAARATTSTRSRTFPRRFASTRSSSPRSAQPCRGMLEQKERLCGRARRPRPGDRDPAQQRRQPQPARTCPLRHGEPRPRARGPDRGGPARSEIRRRPDEPGPRLREQGRLCPGHAGLRGSLAACAGRSHHLELAAAGRRP